MKQKQARRTKKKSNTYKPEFRILFISVVIVLIGILLQDRCVKHEYIAKRNEASGFDKNNILDIKKDSLIRLIEKNYNTHALIVENKSGLNVVIQNMKTVHNFYNNNPNILHVKDADDFKISVTPTEDTLFAFFAFTQKKDDTTKYCKVPTDVLYAMIQLDDN